MRFNIIFGEKPRLMMDNAWLPRIGDTLMLKGEFYKVTRVESKCHKSKGSQTHYLVLPDIICEKE